MLLFRWRANLPAKHAAIVTTSDLMVHAHDGAAVAEVAIAPWWRRRLAYAFRFPGVIEVMAALVLSAAGAAAGNAVFGPAGAIAGRLVGALAGNAIDRALFATSARNFTGRAAPRRPRGDGLDGRRADTRASTAARAFRGK